MIGYELEMKAMFRGSNPGLSRRFDSNHPWHFTDFSDDDLLLVAFDILGSRSNIVSLTVCQHMVKKVSARRALPNFGNAGIMKTVRGCAQLPRGAATHKNRIVCSALDSMRAITLSTQAVSSALERRNVRLHTEKAKNISQLNVTIEDVDGHTEEQQKMFDDPLSVLEDMADVGDFKPRMRKLQIVASEMRVQGRETASLLKNWTFLGKSGTGKTTVARKMATLLHSFGLLSTSNLVETSALDLTGEYVGQSKSKLQEKMDEARGGVLFIDEAYELGVGSFGNEIMTKLVQLLTDERYQVGAQCALPLKITVRLFVFLQFE
jgi:DNA replication protein DnaC